MRRSVTALIIAIAMLAPAATAVAGQVCAADVPIKGQCCCDDGAGEQPVAPSIEANCCCELGQAPADVSRLDVLAPASSSDELPVPVATLTSWRVDGPADSAMAPPARARAPPLSRTLYAQRTALIC